MSFFITALAYYPEDPTYGEPYKHTHVFAHYKTIKDAESAVNRNQCDMHECLYNYIVIEDIGYGVHACVFQDNVKEYWYRWNYTINKWVKTDKPNWSHGMIGWAIG